MVTFKKINIFFFLLTSLIYLNYYKTIYLGTYLKPEETDKNDAALLKLFNHPSGVSIDP